jgi:hypothetical protein
MTTLLESPFTSAKFPQYLEEYQTYRSVGMDLNTRLVKQLPNAAIEECGKKLGVWKRGTLILGSEEELSVLMDYALFHFSRNGVNTVSRFLKMSPPAESSVEMTLLRAMLKAHYSLFSVKAIQENRGLVLSDLLRDNEIFVIDLSMSRSAIPDTLFMGHVLPMPHFHMTSGAFMPVPASIMDDKLPAILDKFYKEGEVLSPSREAAFAAQVIREALRADAMGGMRYQDV